MADGLAIGNLDMSSWKVTPRLLRRANAANRIFNTELRRLDAKIRSIREGQRDFLRVGEIESVYQWQAIQHDLEQTWRAMRP